MAPLAKKQPSALEKLLEKFRNAIGTMTTSLAEGEINADEWKKEMEQALIKYHSSAYMAGARQLSLDELARKRIAGDVRVQLGYLDNFALTIQDSAEFQRGWEERAKSYADAIQIPYWAGRTKMLPLPALPGEGSQCMTHCKCLWSIDTVSEDDNSYDCYWIRAAAESCATCVERASQWSPLRIRNGVLQ